MKKPNTNVNIFLHLDKIDHISCLDIVINTSYNEGTPLSIRGNGECKNQTTNVGGVGDLIMMDIMGFYLT